MRMTPEKMMATIINNLPSKTGRNLQNWIDLLKKHGPERRKDQVEWLKHGHKLGHSTAQIIVWEAEKPADYKPKYCNSI